MVEGSLFGRLTQIGQKLGGNSEVPKQPVEAVEPPKDEQPPVEAVKSMDEGDQVPVDVMQLANETPETSMGDIQIMEEEKPVEMTDDEKRQADLDAEAAEKIKITDSRAAALGTLKDIQNELRQTRERIAQVEKDDGDVAQMQEILKEEMLKARFTKMNGKPYAEGHWETFYATGNAEKNMGRTPELDDEEKSAVFDEVTERFEKQTGKEINNAVYDRVYNMVMNEIHAEATGAAQAEPVAEPIEEVAQQTEDTQEPINLDKLREVDPELRDEVQEAIDNGNGASIEEPSLEDIEKAVMVLEEEDKGFFEAFADWLKDEPELMNLLVDAEDAATEKGQDLLRKLILKTEEGEINPGEIQELAEQLEEVSDGRATLEGALEQMDVDVNTAVVDEETNEVDVDGDGVTDFDLDDGEHSVKESLFGRWFKIDKEAKAAKKAQKKEAKARRIARSRNGSGLVRGLLNTAHEGAEAYNSQKAQEVAKKNAELSKDIKIGLVSSLVTVLSPLASVIAFVGGSAGMAYSGVKGGFDLAGGMGSELGRWISGGAVGAHNEISALKGGAKEFGGKALVKGLEKASSVQEVQQYLEGRTQPAENAYSAIIALSRSNAEMAAALADPATPPEVKDVYRDLIQSNKDVIADLRRSQS